MRSINRESLKRFSFPLGAHVVEVIPGREHCLLHDHFPGMTCAQLYDLSDFARATAKHEPVLVHCSGVDCHLATAMLELIGFENTYRYEGELEELRPHGWRGTA